MQVLRRRIQRPNGVVLNVAMTAVGSWLIWYFSGPLAAELGRFLFENFYGHFFGAPRGGLLGFAEWWFIFMPWEDHVVNRFYNYASTVAPIVIPIIVAPLLYRLSGAIRGVAHRATNGFRSVRLFMTNGFFGAGPTHGLNQAPIHPEPQPTQAQRTAIGYSAPAVLTPARNNQINAARANNTNNTSNTSNTNSTPTASQSNPADNKRKCN